jgi:predicted nucleic acid-binding protein
LSAADLAILDTSVYIDNLRSGRFKDDILALPYVIRLSAVVLAELSRGARSREMKKFVEALRNNIRVITPNENEWAVSGGLVNRIASARRFDIHKTREIHFDVLIALSARRSGAVVITCNRADFTTIREVINFKLICW